MQFRRFMISILVLAVAGSLLAIICYVPAEYRDGRPAITPLADGQVLHIRVTADNVIYVAGVRSLPEDVARDARDAFAGTDPKSQRIEIEADRRSRFGDISNVLARLQNAGFEKVKLLELGEETNMSSSE